MHSQNFSRAPRTLNSIFREILPMKKHFKQKKFDICATNIHRDMESDVQSHKTVYRSRSLHIFSWCAQNEIQKKNNFVWKIISEIKLAPTIYRSANKKLGVMTHFLFSGIEQIRLEQMTFTHHKYVSFDDDLFSFNLFKQQI